MDWNALEAQVATCKLCKLSRTRTQTVLGEGDAQADLLFIGEGPGRQEDLSGRPFVGPAGQLLTRIIEKGMGLQRSQVYITNLVKCRPTVDLQFVKDRPPDIEELQSCAPYLFEQICHIKPKLIVAVGGPAAKFLLQTKIGIAKLRGRWHVFNDIPVMPIYHPSYVLRHGGEQNANNPIKRDVWHDVKMILAKLQELQA